MKSKETSTLRNGNKISSGREHGSRNKAILEMQRIGEERCLSLYNMQVQLAENGDEATGKWLLDKVLPNAKGCRMIEIPLPKMETIETVGEAQDIILSNIGQGVISLDEGEKLFSMTEQRRKSIETKEIIERFNQMESRMQEAGI